jgi:hypothetical protein
VDLPFLPPSGLGARPISRKNMFPTMHAAAPALELKRHFAPQAQSASEKNVTVILMKLEVLFLIIQSQQAFSPVRNEALWH